MHHKIRRVIRYTIRSVLAIILAVLLFGALSYDGNLRGYVEFLNQRDWSQATNAVSANPLSWPNILLPSQSDAEQEENDTSLVIETGEALSDDEVDSFFADFQAEIETQEEDVFGFASDTGSTQTGGVYSGDLDQGGISDEQKEQLLELLKSRQRRIEAQAEFQESQQSSGDVESGSAEELPEE